MVAQPMILRIVLYSSDAVLLVAWQDTLFSVKLQLLLSNCCMPYSFYRQRPRAGCSLGAKASGLGPEDRGFKSLHPDSLFQRWLRYAFARWAKEDPLYRSEGSCGEGSWFNSNRLCSSYLFILMLHQLLDNTRVPLKTRIVSFFS